MRLTVIINSVVCLVGAVLAGLFTGGSVVSIATMQVPWAGALLVAALLLPVAFLVSGIGAWLAYGWGTPQLVIGLVALPWLYSVALVLAMLISFDT